MAAPAHILHPDALLTMNASRQVHSALAIAGGHIQAIDHPDSLQKKYPHHHYLRLPGILLPGLINAHTHLELSYLNRLTPPASPADFTSPATRFVQWVTKMFTLAPAKAALPTVIAAAVQNGAAQSLAHGVTTLADITRHAALSRPALASGPQRIISFGEVIGIGSMRDSHPHLLPDALAPTGSPFVDPALSPHATYTVETPLLASLVQTAITHRLPLMMHLAEFAAETPFLQSHSGPLIDDWPLLRSLMDSQTPTFPAGPIPWAHACGLLTAPVPTLLAHVNYATDSDLALLAASRASVIYCPRTRTFFGHDAITPHRWQDMLSRGINVCLGTDSLASNPDLNPLAEARHVLDLFPNANPLTLLHMLTTHPARALGLSHLTGELRPNLSADLALFPLTPQPTAERTARALLQSLPAPTHTWIAGEATQATPP